MAIVGYVDHISRGLVIGWAADSDRQGEALAISVYVDGREYGRAVANRPRGGIREGTGGRAPDDCEFRCELDPPLSPFLAQHVQVAETWTGTPIAQGDCVLPAPRPRESTPVTPVLLTSAGRSGSTLLMRDFARSPGIVVGARHPNEIKQIAYHAAALRALAADADRARATDPDTMLAPENARRIGANPYYDAGLFTLADPPARLREFFGRSVPERLAAAFGDLILDYYAILRQSQGKPDAVLFAEKGDVAPEVRQAARLFFGRVREVVLVRDPRDLLCSAIAFWKLPADEALAMLATTLPRLLEIRRAAPADTLFVRYEDLLRDPVATRRVISDFLGVAVEHDASAGDAGIAPGHRTSADDAASIGRWHRDLAPAQVDACETTFRRFMQAFDYAPALGAAPVASTAPPGLLRAQGPAEVAAVLAGDCDVAEDGRPMEKLLDLSFARGGNGIGSLGEGWSRPEPDFVWSGAHTCRLRLPPVPDTGPLRVLLIGAPFRRPPVLPSQRVAVLVDGAPAGSATMSAMGVLACDIPPRARPWQPITLTLQLPDAVSPQALGGSGDARLLAFHLRRLQLFRLPAAPAAPAAEPTCGAADEAHSLLLRFESLGEGSTFGLVQRRCGVEPLGLLRFASTPLAPLLQALQERFTGMGRPEAIEIEVAASGREYMVHDRRFGFRYHAWVRPGEMPVEAIHAREARRLPFLIRKLIEDLTEGEKTFVFHGMRPLVESQARQLAAAIRAYGPGRLLWVELADAAHPPGTVVDLGAGLLKGHIDRFAPGEDAHDLSLDGWLAVCRNAAAQGASRRAA